MFPVLYQKKKKSYSSPETVITLLIGYNPIQNKKLKKKSYQLLNTSYVLDMVLETLHTFSDSICTAALGGHWYHPPLCTEV